MRRLLAIVFLFVSALAPSRAHAWVHAQVSSAKASVRAGGDGALRVAVELDVHVMGGYLRELEVAGLDRPMALEASSPASFARASGEPIPFELVVDDSGRVVFRFDERHAPRVGDYVATFAYGSVLGEGAIGAIDGDRVRYAWTFPAWAAGLDSVDIELFAPTGAVAAAIEESGLDGSPRIESVGGETILRFHRSYLPRGVSWPVAFALPRERVPAAIRPPAPSAPRVASIATSRDGRPQPLTRVVVAVFVIVAVIKRVSFARLAKRSEATPKPLVPVPLVAAVALIVGFGVLAQHAWRSIPEVTLGALVSIVALVAQRTARRSSTSRLGAFRPATSADRRRATWERFVMALGPSSWFDATRVVGFIAFAAVAIVLLRLHLREAADSVDALFSIPHAILLLFVLFLVGSARLVPMRVSARLLELESVARSIRIPDELPLGIRLSMHRDANDVAQDVRLRFVSEHRLPGLVRLDVALVERETLGGYTARPVVLVVVRQGSEAERALVRYAGATSIRTAPGGRRARVLPLARATYTLIERLTAAPEAKPEVRVQEPSVIVRPAHAMHA